MLQIDEIAPLVEVRSGGLWRERVEAHEFEFLWEEGNVNSSRLTLRDVCVKAGERVEAFETCVVLQIRQRGNSCPDKAVLNRLRNSEPLPSRGPVTVTRGLLLAIPMMVPLRFLGRGITF